MDEIKPLMYLFFNDCISRIIPGLAVITLYWSNRISDAFETFGKSSIIVCISIFVIAWCIGLVLENLTYMPMAVFNVYKHYRYNKDRSPAADPPALSPRHEMHFIYTKYFAERVLFRIMAFISFLTLCNKPTNLPANIEWKDWYGKAGLIVAVVFWFYAWWSGRINEHTGAYGFGPVRKPQAHEKTLPHAE